MDVLPQDTSKPTFVRRWGPYALKALLLLGVLAAFAVLAPSAPPVLLALVWACLSLLCALGITHRATVRKLRRQMELKEGGRLARFNNGRIVCLIVGFVVAAVGVATLLVDVPTWGAAQWGLAVAAAVVLPVASCVAEKRLKGEFEPAFRAAHVLTVGTVATLAFLAVGFLAISFLTPVPQVTTAAEAFQAAPQPFADSPSALMSEVGKVTALVDGLSSFGLAHAAQVNPWLYHGIDLIATLASLTTLAGLLAVCRLGSSELKRVFQPLEASKGDALESDGGPGLVRKYVVTACVLPVALIGAFFALDHAAAEAVQTEEVTRAEAFVRDQVDLAVFVLDGGYYQYQGVQDLMDETREQAAELASQAQATVVPMVNSFFDACLNNVDSYLDWYYSLPADYEQLAQIVVGTAEDFAAEQLASHLEEGVDASGLENELAQYSVQAAALQNDFYSKLEELKLDEDVPDWLITEHGTLESADLLEVLEPAQQLMSREERLGASGAAGVTAGIATGVATKTLVSKAAEKGFFKKLVEKVAAKLGTRAVSTVVGEAVGGVVGGAAGGTAGSVVPGAGTVAGGTAGATAGAAVGAAVGTAIGVGIDYGLLKLDEWQNRDAYRQQIVDGIEESRAEVLAALGAQDEQGEGDSTQTEGSQTQE